MSVTKSVLVHVGMDQYLVTNTGKQPFWPHDGDIISTNDAAYLRYVKGWNVTITQPQFKVGETVYVTTCIGVFKVKVEGYTTAPVSGELLYKLKGPDIISQSSGRNVLLKDPGPGYDPCSDCPEKDNTPCQPSLPQ